MVESTERIKGSVKVQINTILMFFRFHQMFGTIDAIQENDNQEFVDVVKCVKDFDELLCQQEIEDEEIHTDLLWAALVKIITMMGDAPNLAEAFWTEFQIITLEFLSNDSTDQPEPNGEISLSDARKVELESYYRDFSRNVRNYGGLVNTEVNLIIKYLDKALELALSNVTKAMRRASNSASKSRGKISRPTSQTSIAPRWGRG